MKDYYAILGLNRFADSVSIKAAFKRLAMQYHPDRNPGDLHAEEMFKEINEAYHILSDPLKKSRYDAQLTGFFSESTQQQWQETQRKRYAYWKAKEKPTYSFDKEYFKVQGLAFLVFLVISGICFAFIHTISYFYELKLEKIRQEHLGRIQVVNNLYSMGQIGEAFSEIKILHERFPMEFLFVVARDSLVDVLRAQSEKEFTGGDYKNALEHYTILQQYEFPPRLQTLQQIATCEYRLGDFGNSIQSLKQLFNLQPWNLELLYQIATIYEVNLNNPKEAMTYLTLGKKLFKENLSKVYGDAFEVVMNPKDAPDIYYLIFELRAKVNLKLKDYREAQTDCNWAIYLRPQHGEPYWMRAVAKSKNNELHSICSDLENARKLGVSGTEVMTREFCN